MPSHQIDCGVPPIHRHRKTVIDYDLHVWLIEDNMALTRSHAKFERAASTSIMGDGFTSDVYSERVTDHSNIDTVA